MALQYIPSIKYDETFTLAWIGTDYLSSGQTVITLDMTEPISGVKEITSYDITVVGETEHAYAKINFRYKNPSTWSEWIDIDNITGVTYDECEFLTLQVKILFVYDKQGINTTLTVKDFMIQGERVFTVTDEEFKLDTNNPEVLFEPKDIYKVFELSGFLINSVGEIDNVDIKYRFTQDGGRTYTPWTPLTEDNIKTQKLDELRFAQVQYYCTLDGILPVAIIDIILTGDFQNVSANYLKTNKYGLKEDCVTSFQNNNDTGLYTNNVVNEHLSCYEDTIDRLSQTTDDSNLWKPYNNKVVDWANYLSNGMVDALGWNVDYYKVDPDYNGIDHVLHEYALKNVIDLQKIKIIIPENKFPNETIVINQFNLDLFDTFEIHITKDKFKEKFGIEKRPNQDDIVYICEANTLYYVKHAQAFRDIMNQAIYYKVVLEKYEHKENIQFVHDEAREKIATLTDNTTMEEIFGDETRIEEDKIANKEQMHPTTFYKMRLFVDDKVTTTRQIEKIEKIEFMENHYNFTNIQHVSAVTYDKTDYKLVKGDNRSFISWFSLNNSFNEKKALRQHVYDSYPGPTGYCNLLENFDETDIKGYRYWYEDNKVVFQLNDKYYELVIPKVYSNIWYGVVINLNQRQEKLTMNIYKRPRVINITYFNKSNYDRVILESEDLSGITYYESNGYSPVNNTENTQDTGQNFTLLSSIEYDITPTEFTHSETMNIVGSDIKYSNLRVLSDVIPSNKIQTTLKQIIISDANYLIVGDNANKKLQTTVFWNKNWK